MTISTQYWAHDCSFCIFGAFDVAQNEAHHFGLSDRSSIMSTSTTTMKKSNVSELLSTSFVCIDIIKSLSVLPAIQLGYRCSYFRICKGENTYIHSIDSIYTALANTISIYQKSSGAFKLRNVLQRVNPYIEDNLQVSTVCQRCINGDGSPQSAPTIQRVFAFSSSKPVESREYDFDPKHI